MKLGELVGFFVLLAIGGIAWLIFGDDEKSKLRDTYKGEIIPLLNLPATTFALQGPCSACLIRQSGNIYRDLGLFPSLQDAIEEASKSFRRAKVDQVRVTHSDERSLAIYRQMYDLRGRAEVKKLAGMIFEAISFDGQMNMDLLKSTLREISDAEEGKSTVFFDFECGLCGSRKIQTEDEEPSEQSAVRCTGCGLEFGTFFEFQETMQTRAQSLR